VPVAALALIAVVIGISPQVRAGPPPAVTHFAPEQIRGGSRAVDLVVRSVGGATWLEPIRPGGSPSPSSVAASPGGGSVVLGGPDSAPASSLSVAHSDGSQLEVALPGIRGAAFDAAGDQLAVVDGTGALWRVEARSGLAAFVAAGPYGSDPAWLADGGILAVHLSSADAPAWSAAVIVDPDTGVERPVGDGGAASDQIVYQAIPLADGDVVLVRHRVGGGVVVARIASDGAETLLFERDDAPIMDVSPDGQWIAWTANDRAWAGPAASPSLAHELGSGDAVRFSPDGMYILVFNPGAAVVMDRGGVHLTDAGASACWLGGGRGCRP
jgi:hypothetical protein